jgi:hypothetical protein
VSVNVDKVLLHHVHVSTLSHALGEVSERRPQATPSDAQHVVAVVAHGYLVYEYQR